LDLISAINNTANTKTIRFQAGTYSFRLPDNYYDFVFSNIQNKVFTGTNNQTNLIWITPADTRDALWLFDEWCDSIEMSGLNFTTNLPALDANQPGLYSRGNGALLKIGGSHFNVHDCDFSRAPSFCIAIVGRDLSHPPHDNTINNCTIGDTHADGIHVASGYRTNLTNNTIDGTADDAIGLVQDGDAGGVYPQEINIVGNTIRNSHARGIAVLGVWYVQINHNSIEGTAIYGIELNSATYGTDENGQKFPIWEADIWEGPGYLTGTDRRRSYSIDINHNTIIGAGTLASNAYPYDVKTGIHGMWIANTDSATVTYNTVKGCSGYGVFCGGLAYWANIGPINDGTYIIHDFDDVEPNIEGSVHVEPDPSCIVPDNSASAPHIW
jgi:hypothetical protein